MYQDFNQLRYFTDTLTQTAHKYMLKEGARSHREEADTTPINTLRRIHVVAAIGSFKMVYGLASDKGRGCQNDFRWRNSHKMTGLAWLLSITII